MITAVFISNVKILTSVKLNKIKKKVKIVIPPNNKFIAKAFTNCAKNVYNDPYLFSPTKYKDVENNILDVYKVITYSIEDTIRDMLPIENILQSYIDEALNDDKYEERIDSDDEKEDTDEDKLDTDEEKDDTIYPNAENFTEDGEDFSGNVEFSGYQPNTSNSDQTNEEKTAVQEFFEDTQPIKDINLVDKKNETVNKKEPPTLFNDSDIEE